MEGTSFAPSYWHKATRDVTKRGPPKLCNSHSFPADIATLEEFLQSPLTENGSEIDEAMKTSDVSITDVIAVIQTDQDSSLPTKNTVTDNNLRSNQLPTSISNLDLLSRGQGILQPTLVVPAEQNHRGAIKKGGRGVVRQSSVPARPDYSYTSKGRGAEILVPEVLRPQVPRQSGRQQPYVKILEQPAPKILRFRYVCESRSAGSFPGKRSTPDNPTYPTIQIVGYRGKAFVVVSCVTKDSPHKPHPFNLVSKAVNEDYKNGICTMTVDTNENHGVVQFIGMGVQCVKRRGMAASLDVRRQLRVDPFGAGFAHRNQPTSIDLISVRLCFQVFIEGDTPGRFNIPLIPVVSDPVYDKRRATEPKIMKLSDCVSSVAGGKKDIILLCEKVTRADIQVRFYEENGDWEAFADFQPSQIHKQYAISFKTPRYKTLQVTNPVKVLVQLRRPSDGATSESLPFELWPAYLLEQEPLTHKKPRKTEKLEELRSFQEVARGYRFQENFFTMDSTQPSQGGSPLPYGTPMTPQEDIANPLGSQRSSIYTTKVRGPGLGKPMWYTPTSPPSQSTTSSTEKWNIPRNDVLHPQNNSTANPESKEIMDLDSGDLKWLQSIVDPQSSSVYSQNSLPNIDTLISLNTPRADSNPNNPNLTDSLNKMVLSEFYPN